jgi:hypothetical protein
LVPPLPRCVAVRERGLELSALCSPLPHLRRTAGEGGERSETGEGPAEAQISVK